MTTTLEKNRNLYNELKTLRLKLHLSRKKIDQIKITHFERYEELEQSINDIDTKIFVISKKQDKEMKTINNEISNIHKEKRGKITRTNPIDIPIPTFERTEKGKHLKKC